MSFRLNIIERKQSVLLNEHFTFPIHCLGSFNIGISIQLEKFVKLHKQILRWWINEYIPSFVNDLTNIISAHPNKCQKWISSWQQELKKNVRCLVYYSLDCLVSLVQDSPRSTELEKQATSKDFGAENDGMTSHQSPGQNDPTHRKSSRQAKMPGLKPTDQGVMASLQLNLRWDYRLTCTLSFSELCQVFSLAGQLCQRRTNTGRYCHVHRGGKKRHTREKKRRRAGNEGLYIRSM